MIDTSLWNNKERMRIRIRNLATMILSITAVNGFYVLTQKQWILLGINSLFFLATLPLFASFSKWQKLPPDVSENED